MSNNLTVAYHTTLTYNPHSDGNSTENFDKQQTPTKKCDPYSYEIFAADS